MYNQNIDNVSKKFKPDKNGIVFSTDNSYAYNNDEPAEETAKPGKQKLKISLDKKHRGGKTVTLIQGFVGTAVDLENLAKQLKNHCGTGGSGKDGMVIIQGDQRDKILQWLLKNGFTSTKKI